jgi:hypothetical protein
MAILGIETLTNNGPTHVRDCEPLALVFAQEHGAQAVFESSDVEHFGWILMEV